MKTRVFDQQLTPTIGLRIRSSICSSNEHIWGAQQRVSPRISSPGKLKSLSPFSLYFIVPRRHIPVCTDFNNIPSRIPRRTYVFQSRLRSSFDIDWKVSDNTQLPTFENIASINLTDNELMFIISSIISSIFHSFLFLFSFYSFFFFSSSFQSKRLTHIYSLIVLHSFCQFLLGEEEIRV